MTMEFTRALISKATIKKLKKYTFPEFSDKEIAEGRKGTYSKPLFLEKGNCWYGLYTDQKRLCIVMYHSWDKFKEILPTDKDETEKHNKKVEKEAKDYLKSLGDKNDMSKL